MAVVAFIAATLWISTTGCILYFVGSGRYAKWEEKVRGATSDTTPTTTIEMGDVQHQHPIRSSSTRTTNDDGGDYCFRYRYIYSYRSWPYDK
jgi:hypothetical protein